MPNTLVPIIPHYVNFAAGGNPRRCWTCANSSRRPPGHSTVCRETAEIGRNRWGGRRQFGAFFRPRWDESGNAGDVVQLPGRRSGRREAQRQAAAGRKFGPAPHQNRSASGKIVSGQRRSDFLNQGKGSPGQRDFGGSSADLGLCQGEPSACNCSRMRGRLRIGSWFLALRLIFQLPPQRRHFLAQASELAFNPRERVRLVIRFSTPRRSSRAPSTQGRRQNSAGVRSSPYSTTGRQHPPRSGSWTTRRCSPDTPLGRPAARPPARAALRLPPARPLLASCLPLSVAPKPRSGSRISKSPKPYSQTASSFSATADPWRLSGGFDTSPTPNR